MSKKLKILLITVTFIGLILMNTKAYAANAKLLNDTTRLRKEASTSSDILDLISIEENIEILSEEGDWYKVKYKDNTGYIRKDLVSVEGTIEAPKENQDETASKETTTEETTNNEVESTTAKENKSVEQNETSNGVSSSLQVGYIGKLKSNIEVKIVPSINSSVIATIEENTDFIVTDVINKWCYIEASGTTGWILISKVNSDKADIASSNEENKAEENKVEETTSENKENEANETTNKTEEKTTVNKTKYVSVESLNLRKEPENNAEIIDGLRINTQVTVIEETNSTWCKVTANGETGYVASKYLSDKKVDTSSRSENETRTSNSKTNTQNATGATENATNSEANNTENTASSSSSGTGVSLVEYAKQFLGNPYVYGGTSLTNGCDCSGFVMSVYSHFGYSLPHSSSSLRSVGTAVDKSNLQPGDILCFSGHVGIYMGSNTFIHAANEKLGIITTSLSSSYYVKNYICARRVLN